MRNATPNTKTPRQTHNIGNCLGVYLDVCLDVCLALFVVLCPQ